MSYSPLSVPLTGAFYFVRFVNNGGYMKTNLDKLFKTSKSLEEDGIDFAIDDTTSFRVRHFTGSNPRTKSAMASHYKPYARQIDMKTLGQEKQDEIMIKMFIDSCLVSWKGVFSENGEELPLTKENALELFKSLPALFDSLWKHANNFENYREDLGNF